MTRNVLLYAPAAVCIAFAGLIALFGRSDGLVILGAVALGMALVGHTYQEVLDHRRIH